MKYFIFIVFFVSQLGNAQDLKQLRIEYPNSVKASEITIKLEEQLGAINASEKPVLLAYKGAVLTLKAKFSKKKSEKKEFFKEGVSLIESAVKADSSNIEIRYLRLSVQENSPRFLGYHKNMEEDKEFILKNYANVSSKELKVIIKEFISKSENFSELEKLELEDF